MRFPILLVILGACVFPMNRAEIEEANRQHVWRLCQDENYAYETGYNVGLKRGHLDTSWAATSCAPATRDRVRERYQHGYHQGIANAPIVVRGSVTAASTGATCRFASDCYEGQACRPDAYGTHVCMGGGYAGDACWFGSDCVSGSCDVGAKTCR